MKKLVAFYSRADENYFDGSYRYIEVGNTEKVARMIAGIKGADMFRIEQKIPYAADYSTATAQAKKDRQENLRPELKALPDLSGMMRFILGILTIGELCRWQSTHSWIVRTLKAK